MKKIYKVAISFAFIALTACGTSHKGADSLYTQGLGGESEVYGQKIYPVTTKAPANQSYFYDYDKNSLRSDYYPSVDAQAKYLLTHPSAKVLITGNTDSRGSREYNIALGERRALSVVERLKMAGVKPSQVKTISYGSEKPVALGETESAFAKNRRADLIYLSE
jgi:peptidoglycan-associated lipoprotein